MSVVVAVRVRPFNERERARDAKCVVEMQGATTKALPCLRQPNVPDHASPKREGKLLQLRLRILVYISVRELCITGAALVESK